LSKRTEPSPQWAGYLCAQGLRGKLRGTAGNGGGADAEDDPISHAPARPESKV